MRKSDFTVKGKDISFGALTSGAFGGNAPVAMTDSAIASGGAYLVGELEKRTDIISEPLSSVTYPRDIPMKSGGGWVEYISALNVDYGLSGDGVHAGGANVVPIIQANFDKDLFKTHVYSVYMRIGILDMLRDKVTGRNIETLLGEGLRLAYDKHMDKNVYVGLEDYGTTGLLNSADVTATNVDAGGGGGTDWSGKTPDEILTDINNAIEAVWDASANDISALPNHILIPHTQFNKIATTRLGTVSDTTILDFLLDNNISKRNGTDLVIAPVPWCKEIGAGSTDRMAVYCNKDRFVACEELVPLHRVATQTNMQNLSYDSLFMSNISEVEFFYHQTIGYFDGI